MCVHRMVVCPPRPELRAILEAKFASEDQQHWMEVRDRWIDLMGSQSRGTLG